MLLLRSKGQR